MRFKNSEEPIDSGLNLGPKSRHLLSRIDIHTMGELQSIGSVEAYLRCLDQGEPLSLNLLWALEGALTSQPWQAIARERRQELLAALEIAKTGR